MKKMKIDLSSANAAGLIGRRLASQLRIESIGSGVNLSGFSIYESGRRDEFESPTLRQKVHSVRDVCVESIAILIAKSIEIDSIDSGSSG